MYVIKRNNQYLVSHCQALIFKTDIKEAKEFTSKTEAIKTCVKWKINTDNIKLKNHEENN